MKCILVSRRRILVGSLFVGVLAAGCAAAPSPTPAKPAAAPSPAPTQPVPATKSAAAPPASTPVPTASTAVAKPTVAPTALRVERIKFGIPTKSFAFMPFFVGVAKDIFRKNGLEVAFSQSQPQPMVAALINGELDFGSGPTIANVSLSTASSPVKFVAGTGDFPAFFLVVASSVKSVPDLKGKRLAISTPDGVVARIARAIVTKHGLVADRDVEMVPLGTVENGFPALVNGAVQGAILSPPTDSVANRAGFPTIAAAGDYIKTMQAGVATTDTKLREQRDLVKRMIRATIESFQYARDHKVDSIPVLVKEYALSEEEAGGIFDSMVKIYRYDGLIDDDVLQEIIDAWKVQTSSKENIPTTKIADLSLAREVLKEMEKR